MLQSNALFDGIGKKAKELFCLYEEVKVSHSLSSLYNSSVQYSTVLKAEAYSKSFFKPLNLVLSVFNSMDICRYKVVFVSVSFVC